MGVTTPVRGHSSLPESRRLPQNELRFENHLLPARRLVCSIADAAEAQRDLTGQRKTAVPRAPVRSTETVASHGVLHSMSVLLLDKKCYIGGVQLPRCVALHRLPCIDIDCYLSGRAAAQGEYSLLGNYHYYVSMERCQVL